MRGLSAVYSEGFLSAGPSNVQYRTQNPTLYQRFFTVRASRFKGKWGSTALDITTERPDFVISRSTADVPVSCLLKMLLLLPITVAAGPVSEPTHGTASNIQAAILTPTRLEAEEAIVGNVTINNGEIFDLHDPEEDKRLYRLANSLHATTRPDVIRQQLLFKSGDQYSSRVLEESERIIRSNRYIQEVSIRPVRIENGVVDIDVRTTDTWTLVPKLSFGRRGGESKVKLGLQETNLFGTGIEIGVAYKSDVDRDSSAIRIIDRHLGNSWYGIEAEYADNSDGYTQLLKINKPFFSLEATGAGGLSYFDDDKIESLYDRGEALAEYRHQTRSHEFYAGWSKGLTDGWAHRYTAGLAYDEHRFSPVATSMAPMSVVPEDRKLVYPFVGVEFMQDRFEKTENLDQIKRVEDRYLGTLVSARLGYAGTAFGSDRNAWIVSAQAKTGFGSSLSSSLLLASGLTTRWEFDGLQNLALDASAKYYKRQSEKRLFYASLSGTYGHNLDADNQLYLGGDNGLRGYPLRYQGGDKRALLTVEQRIFTDWYPFRLFRVGAAVFFDAGRTWGINPVGSSNLGLLKDVGFGLRIGNTRSGLYDMIHVDLAFPLDGDDSIDNVQLVIETKKGF
jgi:hypothetical protein